MNEVLQWITLAILSFLLLGILRQVALTLPPPARAVPSGPEIGRRVPKRALAELKRVVPGEDLPEGFLVVFVTESCVGCQQLLGNLVETRDLMAAQQLVLVAKDPSPQFRGALQEIGLPTIHDENGELWEACQVTATPLVIRLDGDGRVVAKEVTHRVDRIAITVP